MKKAILAAVVTLVIGIGLMSILTDGLEIGVVAAIAVMGGFIIYFNDKKK